jgi:Domain of unknown function (DUF1996)
MASLVWDASIHSWHREKLLNMYTTFKARKVSRMSSVKDSHNLTTCTDFGFDVEINQLMASNCTSCSVRQDKSAYWSPQMYFRHDNGTFEIVPTQGGLTV